jgi:hypothetical protein
MIRPNKINVLERYTSFRHSDSMSDDEFAVKYAKLNAMLKK